MNRYPTGLHVYWYTEANGHIPAVVLGSTPKRVRIEADTVDGPYITTVTPSKLEPQWECLLDELDSDQRRIIELYCELTDRVSTTQSPWFLSLTKTVEAIVYGQKPEGIEEQVGALFVWARTWPNAIEFCNLLKTYDGKASA